MSSKRRPILVTGAHRSGTTWVGKMLSAGGEGTYISEPLNLWHRPGVMRTRVPYWYTYICEENEADYLPALRETLQFRYHAWAELRSLRSRKDVLRMGRDWSTFFKGNFFNRRPLLKDPFAIFSAPWFAQKLDCQVVITVRHPAAFASSLKRLQWPFEFKDLLAQPLLMRDWLAPFQEQMERMLQMPDDVIGQSSLLWRIIYQVVAELQKRFPCLEVVRHEDLSLDPLNGYHALYVALGLEFNAHAREAVLKSSNPENPREVSQKAVHAYHLDSRANLHNWKNRLTAEEIVRIRTLTEDLAARYYPEIAWE